MTPTTGLKVETQALVGFGRERAEDAFVASVLPAALRGHAAIPQQAFGKFDFSAKYHADWVGLINARVPEFNAVRDQLWDQGHSLVAVAAAYQHTDIQSAYSIDQQDGKLDNYLNKDWLSTQNITSRPGAATPPFPGIPDSPRPQGSDRRYGNPAPGDIPEHEGVPSITELPPRTRTLHLPGDQQGSNVDVQIPVWDVHPGVENDALAKLVNSHLDLLIQVDSLSITLGIRTPLKSYITKAYASSPTLIERRATGAGTVANALREMTGNFTGETDNLKGQWWGNSPLGIGGAAGSYYVLAAATQRYMTKSETKLRWMYQQGLIVSKTVAAVRNAYGKAIVDHIDKLTDAVRAYTAAASRSFNCKEAGDVAAAIDAFTDALIANAKAHLAQLSNGFDIEAKQQQFTQNYEGSNSEYQQSESFPRLSSINSYKTPADWKPKPDHPSRYAELDNQP